jgi:hypothetical protein
MRAGPVRARPAAAAVSGEENAVIEATMTDGAGNHFAAWQEPELYATEVRAAVRSLR